MEKIIYNGLRTVILYRMLAWGVCVVGSQETRGKLTYPPTESEIFY